MAFKKSKTQKQEKDVQTLTGILDAQDAEILVVQPDDCKVIFMNDGAKKRMPKECISCKDGYADDFANLCEHCIKKEIADVQDDENSGEADGNERFQVETRSGEVLRGYRREIKVPNAEPAVALFLEDNSHESAVNEKLYRLAYMDSLTGVPNRQKLKEDFAAKAAAIEADKISGVMAIMDLDNFKAVNDTYGHNTGDLLLQRIAEHLNEEPDFKSHFYRLGGDEFVLFLTGEPVPDVEKHYLPILQGAMNSYTLPNIDANCTLSMGVAIFPKHGHSYTDLLRKADIALYKAKSGGRDEIVVFEDRYDTAKKFKDFYVSIQPVLTAHQTTYAYALSDMGHASNSISEQETVLDGFDRTIDIIGLDEIGAGSRDKYIVHYSNQLLNSSVRKNLPKEKFIISLPVAMGTDANTLTKYQMLRRCGYQMAVMEHPGESLPPEIMELVDFCKFATSVDAGVQKSIIKKYPGKKFIAANVNTAEEFEKAKMNGFVLFQGYFFGNVIKPQKKKEIDPIKANYFRLLQLTATDDYTDFKEIGQVIAADVALSYKLLRLLNSAAVGLTNRISSIEMGVAYLGEENLKKWIALLALRGVADGSPLELVRISLIRAQFGELLAGKMMPTRNKKAVFMTGMFSLLHIAMEIPQSELLDEIPLSEDIKKSLINGNGPYSDMMHFYVSYEYGNWEDVSAFARKNQLTDKMITDSYVAAVKWYESLIAEMK